MLKIDDEYRIYSKENSGPYKFVCNISTYTDFDISLWDMHRTITESLYKYSNNSKDICLAGKSVADNSVVKVTIGIEKVIYNYPATVIFWKDHTKTVVKCQGEDSYDPQKGFMLCILKKLMGNQGNYNNFIKKWCPEDIFETMSIRDADGVKFTQATITDKKG